MRLLLIAACVMVLCGCRSVETTTTTKFDASGKVVEQTVVEKRDTGWILRKKGVVSHSSVFLGKITTSVDKETSTIMPCVEVLLGDNYFSDIPMCNEIQGGANYSEYLHVEKSLWGAELSVFDYNRQSAGTGAPEPSVKIKIDTTANVPAPQAKK